jgi:hypothetical protein
MEVEVINRAYSVFSDVENEMDEDLEIQYNIVRSAREDTGAPPPHTPVLSAEEYESPGKMVWRHASQVVAIDGEVLICSDWWEEVVCFS